MNKGKVLDKTLISVLLEDNSFLNSFPGIVDVAAFFYSTIQRGLPPVFKEMNITTVGEYLCKMNEGDQKAIQVYEKMRETCGF